MIIRCFQAHRYNAAVLAFIKRLVSDNFKERRYLIESTVINALNNRDSIRYTELFRKYHLSIEAAAIHYFDFGITQLNRVQEMARQDDIADLVIEMKHGLDQMMLTYLNKLIPDNGIVGEAMPPFISKLNSKLPNSAEGA